jgi:hypothetical protein
MKVALFCFVLFAFSFAQFDQSRIQLETISLVEDSTQASNTHNEYVDTASGSLANRQCRDYFHPISNVRSNNGFQNSGTYFTVTFSNIVGTSVTFTLQDPDDGDVYADVNGDQSHTCNQGATCVIDYFCDIYESTSALELEVNTPDDLTAVEVTTYDVSVRQYTDEVPDINRSFQQSTAVGETYDVNNLGPENWVHYHHTLDASVAELAAESTLYIAVTVSDPLINGEAYICVSFDNIVANDAATPGNTNSFTPEGEFEQGNNFSVNNAPCETRCARGTLDAVNRQFYIAMEASVICAEDDLWIGIRTPSDASYSIDITFGNVPEVTQISQSTTSVEGRLTDTCNVANGDYACEAYFILDSQTIASFGGSDSRLGPVIDIEAFGAINGEFQVTLSTGLEGDSSNCGTIVSQCNFGTTGTATGAVDSSCHLVMQPCDIDASSDYAVTVKTVNRVDTSETADFGIEIHIEQWEITEFDLDAPRVLFGSIVPGHYNHYEVELTVDDIFTDSYFEAEMNPENPVEDSISFGWNFNALAGNPNSPCYDARGVCTTSQTNCGTGYDYEYSGNTAITFCRFLYLPCPISEGIDYYYNTQLSRNTLGPNGEKVAQLEPGTYYFAVWSPLGEESEYQVPDIKYTLNFALRRSIPLYENVVTQGRVYFLDYSRQYVITIPNDPTIGTVNILADNVRNGIVRFYANCGSLAGDCPCWDFVDTCVAQPLSDSATYFDRSGKFGEPARLTRCTLQVPRCSCDDNQIYVSAQTKLPGGLEYYDGDASGNIAYYTTRDDIDVNDDADFPNLNSRFLFGYDREKAATFTLTTFFHTTAGLDEIEEIFASRAGVSVSGHLTPVTSYDQADNLDAKYYSVKFDAVSTTENDALFVSLVIGRGVQDHDFGLDDSDSDLDSEITLAVGQDFIPDLHFSEGSDDDELYAGCPFDYCTAFADRTGGFSNDYDTLSDLSTCTIVYQPCSNRCSNRELGFSSDVEYIIAVVPRTNANEEYLVTDEYFSVQVQIVDQSPKAVTDGLTFWGGVRTGEYLHFSFDVSGTPSNSRLIVELYQDDKQQTPLELYMNYFDGNGEPVRAGRTEDCYEHMFCEVCTLSGNRQNKCLYDIPACQLSEQNGVYYISVSNEVFEDYNYLDEEYYEGYDGDNDVYNRGARYIEGTPSITTLSFFTLNIRTESLEELLPNGVPVPIVGSLFSDETSYYSVTVPSTNGNIIGRILNMEFLSYNSDVSVFLSTLSPDEVCFECVSPFTANRGTVYRFRRIPCEREAQTYYIAVSYTEDLDFDGDCERAEFAINARIEDISRTSVSLTSQTGTPRITDIYDTSVAPNTPFSVSADEFRVVSFSINAQEGEFFSVTVSMDAPSPDNGESFDFYLSQDDYTIPSGSIDDFDFGTPSSASCVSPAVAACTGVDDTTPCTRYIFPCELPEGQSNWFITLSGEPLSPGESTPNINIRIEQYANEAIIDVPASTDFNPQVTTLTLDDTLEEPYYSYRTSSSLGMNGGESLEFSISPAVSNFYVRVSEETGENCPFTCNGQTCTIYACDSISPRTWYFFIDQQGVQTVSITIQRGVASSSNPSQITALPLNVQVDGLAQGNAGTAQEEFQYFRLNVPQSDSGRFDVTYTGVGGTLFSVDETTFLPGFSAGTNEIVMFSDESTDSTSCGAAPFTFPSEDCCYDAVNQLFAVSGQTADYSITVNTESFLGNTPRTFGSSGSVTGAVIQGDDQVDMITFTVNAGDDLFFDFDVTLGNAQLYLNSGDRAGSEANDPLAGYCWANLGLIQSVCPTNFPCTATIPACEFQSCKNPASSSYTYTFAVIGTENSEYDLSFQSYNSVRDVSSGNVRLSFPLDSSIDDIRSVGDNFVLYSQYVYDFTDNPLDVPEYIPTSNAVDSFTQALYPRVVFTFDNFQDSLGNVLDDFPVRIFIDTEPAGDQLPCYDSDRLDSPRTLLPCIGGAQSSNTPASITCEINICDIGCGTSIYFGVAREQAGPADFTFDFSAVKEYDDLVENDEVQNLQLSLTGSSGSVSRTPTDDNAVVFVRVTSPSVNPGDFPVFTVTPTILTGGDPNTEITVTQITGAATTCGGTETAPDQDDVNGCVNVGLSETCLFEGDPCTSEFSSIDSSLPTFYRVERVTGAGAWGFDFEYSIVDIQALDSSSTTLSVSGNTQYSATKEISAFTWQFYSFFINENDGYSYLSVTIDNLRCEANGEFLEVYANWGSAATTVSDMADSHLPDQWPSSECDLSSDDNFPWTSYSMDTCQFNAGGYRVAVFAPKDIIFFNDPTTITPIGEPVPAVYSISASLNTLEHVTMTGCDLTQSTTNFVSRVEIPIGATNKGSLLSFTVSTEDDADNVDLLISANSHPYGNGSDECDFDDNDEGVYSCSGTGSCTISIDRCAFVDGIWYAYLDFTPTSDVTISYSLDSLYIPVIDAVANSGQVYSGRLITDSASYYQYYKIVSSTSFTIDLNTPTCVSGDCSVEMELYGGSRGHGFGSDASLSDCNESCGCDCSDDLIDSCTGDCRLFINGCSQPTSEYFIALYSDDSFDDGCRFELTVSSFSTSDAVDLVADVPLCVSAPCVNLYEISNIDQDEFVTFTISDGGATSDDIDLYFGTSMDCLSSRTCANGAECSFTFGSCELDLSGSIYVLIVRRTCLDCTQTDGGYSVTYSVTSTDVTTLSLNTPLAATADYARFTANGFVQADRDINVISGENRVPAVAGGCSTCSTLLSSGSSLIESPSVGLTLSSVTVQNINGGSSVSVQLNGGGEYVHYAYTPAAGVDSIDVNFVNVEYSPDDIVGGDISNINLVRFGSGSVPFTIGCGNTACSDLGTALASGACLDAFNRENIPTCGTDTIYFTLSYCGDLDCPIEFDMFITENGGSRTFVQGGNHNSNYVSVSSVGPDDCVTSSPNLEFYTTVTDILLVSIRQPGSLVSADTFAVQVSSCETGFGESCSVDATEAGINSSCSIPLTDCSSGHCMTPGDYRITFTPPTGPYEFEYQVITQYVDISSSASGTIIGDTAHFYRITDSNTALSIALDITRGPALNFAVLGSCSSDDDYKFVETKMCMFGTCHTWIPTKAKQTVESNLYIVLESASAFDATGAQQSVNQEGEINVDYEKETIYSITITRGTANCVAPPSTGFCADTSRGAAINVWADVSNNVWSFASSSGRDAQAECLYNDLIDRCVAPSVECKQFLKAFACVNTFPQCDADGYQMGVCHDLCSQVEDVCGPFAKEAAAGNTEFLIYDCASPRYQSGSTGSCYENLPVTVSPVVVDPLSFFNDDDELDLNPYGLPDTLETPEFDPIYATIPAIANDDDDGNKKIFENSDDTVVEENSSSTFSFSFLLLALCAFAFFF